MSQFNNQTRYFVRLAATVLAVISLNANSQNNIAGNAADANTLNGLNSIESISASRMPGGEIVVKVGMKQVIDMPPEAFTIGAPPRIALTFPRTTNALGEKTQEFAEGDLRSATIVQAADRTRLVLNLNQMLTYDTPKIEGRTMIMTLRPIEGTADSLVSRFAESRPALQKHSLRDVDFHRGKNGEGRVQVDLSDPNVGIDIRQQGKTIVVDFLKTSLPRNLQRKLDVSDFATPVQILDTYEQGENVRLVIEPKNQWVYSAFQADNKFNIEVKQVIEDKKAEKARLGYTGEKLTLNFQNITAREALSVIADFTNLNIVISDTVTGSLTLRLKDVPWDQALDIILQSKGLDKRTNGNVVQVAPREELALKEKIELTANQDIENLEPLRTESFLLSYTKGVDLATLLTNDKQRILTKRGTAVVDTRTNTIFVQDTPSGLDEARKIIKQLDVAVRQVIIEARFVEAKETFARSLGGRLNSTNNPINPPNYLQPGAGVATGSSLNLPGFSGSLASTAAGTLGMVFTAASGQALSLELMAAQVDGKTKSIASPRVLTADSTLAVIESGVEIPYATYSAAGTNVQFKKALLSLNVTPKITPDDRVNMKVILTQDTVGTIYFGIPSIDTKKVDTQVLVENGGTLVIGGVYKQEDLDTRNSVPLLADIPILGWLFKNEVRTSEKKELLVFITPRIMSESLNLR
ncbi:MAG: secretin [Gallionellales bacterium 35-53-114]|jgi:type IV pilus assembly protein PilQ|nr:MAG: secretin [Gallionellales bacterium 35-53-114]OYZ62381.1 MAG: secretin [Gallionellales bacterium 24-53-125]OZB07420.1 MAG: secretin [Gallionellales bacterium 39-52-133]HQS59597.1 type IV pilus secretin PilQ [Gallionellaceae bacterium]HQS75500.1 type IV pilus secretin PilQ [Gallionellaceae bacterium]